MEEIWIGDSVAATGSPVGMHGFEPIHIGAISTTISRSAEVERYEKLIGHHVSLCFTDIAYTPRGGDNIISLNAVADMNCFIRCCRK